MNKIAQRRGRLNKIWEGMNSPGETVSGMFSPEFTRLMDRLREVDDEAREHAVDLKDILKTAKSNFNRREYMTTITFLGRFHERIDLIKQQFLHLIKETDMVHNEFLFGDLDPEHRSYLTDKMTEKFKPKSKAPVKPAPGKADDGVTKEAGVKDWWHNLTSDRGKALKSWEKRFPKKAKEIKRQTEKMLTRSEMFLNYTLSTFKTLASLRATRGLEEYLKASDGFIQKYDAYDAAFAEYFNGSVRSFVESQKEFDKMRAEKDALTKKMVERPEDMPQDGDRPGIGDLPPDSESGVKTQPMGGKTTNEVLKDMEQGKDPGGEPVPDDETLRKLMHEPKGLSDQEKFEFMTDPLGQEPSSMPRDFPKPDLFAPDTSKEVTNTDPDSFMGMMPSARPAPAQVSSDPDSFLSMMPNAPARAPGIAPLSPVDLPESLPYASTMLSQKIPTPADPPPAMPSMPSVRMPPAARVPQIDEVMMPEERAYMYQPQTSTKPEGVKPPPSTQRHVQGPGTMMGVAPPPSGPATMRSPTPATQPAARPPTKTLAYKPLSSLTQEFITNVTKLADGNPLVMASEIIKFAKTIEETDKKTSDRLLAVAQNLLK